VLPGCVKPACVVFQNGVIESVLAHGEAPPQAELNEYGEQYILPGLIDAHIHVNDPGRADWEGFETATRAAAAGGFTCIVDMPLNCIPATTTVEALEAKRLAANGGSMVDFLFWGGAVHGNAQHLKALAEAGVAGFKAFMVHPGIEEFSMVDEADLRQAMPVIAETGLPLLVHAEAPGPIEAVTSAPGAWNDYAAYLRSRPDESEAQAIQLLIRLCEEYKCHVHIVHLSSATGLESLRKARETGLPITVETCPHYLYWAAEGIGAGNTALKCAPPIRSQANQDQLWQALRARDIDLIATDHSPCPAAMKKMETGDFRQAWGGISSVSLAISVVWTKAQLHGFEIGDVVRWLCEQPARLAGVSKEKGTIAPGCDADFAVFDDKETWQVTPDDLHFKNKVSPYVNERLRGRVTATYLRGNLIYSRANLADGAAFSAAFNGHECRVRK
jgi:allantoinase